MKQRFTSVDVRAMVRSIRPRLLGAKVANVYDINNKLYILKFTSATASTDTDETTENKWFLILEAGVRFNLTEYERGSAGLPSAWTMKLRKLLRGKRLGDIRQVGSDRVIIMEFGAGEKVVIIALEMYAKGNIVVMDNSYKVTMLLRRYAYNEEEKVEVGLPYPMALAAKKADEADVNGRGGVSDITDDDIVKELDGKSNVKGMSSALLKFVPFASPQMATLAVKSSMEDGEVEPSKILRSAIEWCYAALSEVSTIKTVAGYGLKEEGKEGKIVDYAPLKRLLKGGGLDDGMITEYQSFSECVDDYYTRLMRAQLESQLVQKETQMKSKVENIKADQSRRMGELEKEQQSLWDQAVALEANTGIADAAIQMVNALLAAKLRWDDLAIAIKQQQRAGHPLATHIRQLALNNNRISIVLEKPGAVENEDEDTTVEVWLDLSQSAQSNVALLHEERKAMKEKMSKTEDQMAKAVKIAEKRLKGKTAGNEGAATLGGAEKQLLAKRRKKFWFQKFFWFISSDRLLVLAGRDAQQNELLWRRYLAPTDIYVHADLAGAATVIIKMPKGGIEPPQRTLAEAGQYSLCRSRAWDNKIVTSAWWVWAKQVSKTAPTGEFLSTGSFMIRGKKNFLPPSGRLEMGLGVMWTVTDDSAEKYRAQRLQREKQMEEEREKEKPVESRNEEDDEGPGVVENFDFNPKGNDEQNSDKKNGKREGGQAGNKGAMSRQQRKQAKKGATGKEGSEEEEAGDEARATPQEKGEKTKPLTRHQRKKLAKIKEKYGDQDEEEREIRMKLMGSKEVKLLEKKEDEKKEEEGLETKEDESVDKSNEITTGKNICFKCGEEGHLASACPNAGKGEEEQQQEEGEVDSDDEDEEEKVTSGGGIAHTLDRLQAWPDWKEDEVLGAIMVCAPYQAMTHIPIKVKFTPGQMKRGKAAQLGIKLLQGQLEGELRSARAAASKASNEEDGEASANAATITRHALDLLRLVPIEEASDAIGVSNVKLAASGVQRLQQKSKKEKKQLAKQREKEALLAMDG